MHWLGGSNKKEAVNKLWRHIGAVNDSTNIRYSEPFMEYDYKGMPIRFYRNVDTTAKYLLELAPADAKEIRKLCDNIRKVQNLSEPITDLKGVKVTKKNRPPLSMFFSALSVLRMINTYSKISREQYANRFSHEGIRELLRSLPGDKQGIFMMFLTMGSLSRGDGGFPEGGSLPFVGRIVKTFTSLGGEILYNTRADRVVFEDGQATGVKIADRRLSADAVIITADTMAVDYLFDTPLKAPWLDNMRKVTGPTMVTFICLGINADLTKYPSYYIFKLKKPIKLASQTYEYLSVSNYASDTAYSPKGKTAMTIQLSGDTYDFWKKVERKIDILRRNKKLLMMLFLQ